MLKSLILILVLTTSTVCSAREHILFLGSSTIASWGDLASHFPQFKTTNQGIGGSTYRSLSKRAYNVVRENPSDKIVIYAGDNDVSLVYRRSAQRIVQDFIETIEQIRMASPNIEIYVVSVKPSPLRRYARRKIEQVNEGLNISAENLDGVYFVDIYSLMLAPSGQLNRSLYRDGLHMTLSGYKLWAKALNEVLDER